MNKTDFQPTDGEQGFSKHVQNLMGIRDVLMRREYMEAVARKEGAEAGRQLLREFGEAWEQRQQLARGAR